ncbi:MAG: T9SS type A sorting domain-containing protein, partial [Bacteroidia bacterium]|nr:T9SS type A sorting domain-containing protein [Bacteroidia bacterium]
TTLWAQESIGVSCISPRTKVKVNITQVTVALNPINVTCNGGSTGSFTLGTITCGTAPFSYSVNSGAFGPIPTNLVAGSYSIVAKDATSLVSGPISLTITQPMWTINNPTATNVVVCEGATMATLAGSANLSTMVTGSQVLTFGLAGQPTELSSGTVPLSPSVTPNIISTATLSALPAGAIITSVKLSMPTISAQGSSWASDVRLGLSGAISADYVKDSLAGNTATTFNYKKYLTPTASVVAGGTVNLSYYDYFDDNLGTAESIFPTGASVATLTVNYSYNAPANVTWWDSSLGGALLVANDTLNAVGTTVLPNTLTSGVYNFYAQADNASCFAPARTLTTVTVNAKATTPIVTAGGATTFCAGDSVQLTSSVTLLNTWSNAATTAVIKVTTSNTYYTIANNANGCASDTSNKITVVVNALPSTPIVTSTANVITCNTPSVTLKTTNYSTGLVWSNAATTDSLVLTSAGTFSATHTDVNGCKSAVSNSLVITDSLNSNFTLNAASPNDSICLGSSTALSVTGIAGGLTYTWTPSATLNASTGTSVIATPTVPTTYSVKSDNGVACTTTKTITIVPIILPIVAVAGDSAICAGLSTTLTASGANNYTWTSGPATATNTVMPTTLTTYQVIGTNAFGCADTALFMVNVNALPVAPIVSATSPEINCIVTSVTLSASNYTTGLTWSNGDTTTTSTILVAGSFTAINTDAKGCVSVNSNVVTIANNTGIVFTVNNPTPSDSVCIGASVGLGVTGAGLTYTWSPSGTLSSSTGANVVATATTGTTTYSVVANNGAGCTSTKTVTITGVPNAIVTATAASPVVTVTSGNISNSITVTGATTFNFTSSVTGVATHTMVAGTALTTSINDSLGATTIGSGTVDYVITGYNVIGCPSAPVMVTVNISSVVALANKTIDANLNIYPNPTANILNIVVKANTLSVTMFDATGKIVKQANVNANSTQLTVSDLTSGAYSLRITTEAGTTVKKIIVTKE